MRGLDERYFAVDGTPTDCVLVGLQRLIPGKAVDLVLSGINHGGNLGEDVTYSGTIAAAMEATLFKVRSIALSQVCGDRAAIKWATAEKFALPLIRRLVAAPWAEDVLVNVNFPDRVAGSVRGVRLARQGKRKLGDEIVEGQDPRGEAYLWIGAVKEHAEIQPGTDLAAIEEGYVAVTPIHLDMTHDASFGSLSIVAEEISSKNLAVIYHLRGFSQVNAKRRTILR